jgi:WXG100 family type VII secretion target
MGSQSTRSKNNSTYTKGDPMSAPQIRCDHDQIQKISSQFSAQSSAIAGINRKLKAAQATLEGGDWIGRGATEFLKEMNSDINPAMKRLEKAMDEAAKVTKQVSQVMKDADEESSRILIIIQS